MSSGAGVKLLGFAGSLRKDAFSKAVLRAAQEAAAGKAEFEIFSLEEIPLYNQDVEDAGHPESVTKFKEAIAAANALVIATPEYNYGIPGVLKNALDWASRPGYKSVLKDKLVLMMASSPAATGGVRALPQLRQTLSACLSRVLPMPEIVIASAGQKIVDGKLTDEDSLKYITRSVEQLIDAAQS